MGGRVNPVPGGVFTAGFDQPRPLSAEVKTHIHGAQDIAARAGTPILAPESGKAFCYVGLRPEGRGKWGRSFDVGGDPFPFRDYFYDMYGGLIVLQSDTGLTHVITHSWMNQLFNLKPFVGLTVRTVEATDGPWPVGLMTEPIWFQTGEQIGWVGNAGFSTGAHCHWEMHHGSRWERHADRIDPREWLGGGA